jgi:hypothetical protein
MSKGKNQVVIPEHLRALWTQNEQRVNMPPGLIAAMNGQETAGSSKYIDDPTAYHYPLNAEGRRIAAHTGQVSTAFGPYGILESTAAKPGYGVQPLQNKSLEEQTRFMADYAAARAKQAGGWEKGVAGYGEGDKYGREVFAKLNGGSAGSASPIVAQAQAPVVASAEPLGSGLKLPGARLEPAQSPITQVAEAPVQVAPLAQAPQGPDPWMAFQNQMASRQNKVAADDLNYVVRAADAMPNWGPAQIQAPQARQNLQAFQGYLPRARQLRA